jgi:GGDEF domain-containing protein
MLAGSPFGRPARPVADAPLAALSDGEELAKSWLLLLLAQAPLSAAASVPAADLAREAPELCRAMVAALASDAELDRLRADGDRAALAARAGALAGAVDPAGAAAAVGALRGVLWSAVTEVLVRPDPEQVAQLAARLSLVADVVAAAALAPADVLPVRGPSAGGDSGDRAPAGADPRGGGGPASPSHGLWSAAAVRPEATAPLTSGGTAPDASAPSPLEADAVESGEQPGATAPRLTPVPDIAGDGGAATPAAGAEDEPPDAVVPADVFPSVIAAAAEDRGEPWATAVVRRLGRLVAEGVPCCVLAVDVDDADRLLAADVNGEARAMLDRIERALRDELRPGDAAVRERIGRVWIVAQAGGIEGARALGQRLADAVAAAGTLHGVPLRASIGIAACPDDGGDPTSLVAHADEGVFAARAAGVTIA